MDMGKIYQMYKDGLLFVEAEGHWISMYSRQHRNTVVIYLDEYYQINESRQDIHYPDVEDEDVEYLPVIRKVKWNQRVEIISGWKYV